MAYFRKLTDKKEELLKLLKKEQRWLILINADPDALASAMALKRILARRVEAVAIAQVNTISRPDNLAMIKLLRIPSKKLTPALAAQYDHFAIVDSQPHHHPDFAPYRYSIIIDHHPLSQENPMEADFIEHRPEYGSNSSIMTEYLYNFGIRPGKLLATALLYGIKTDTHSFELKFDDIDIKAFRYLTKFYSPNLLHKILRSEFKQEWFKYFAVAFNKIRRFRHGMVINIGEVESPDMLVVLADLFLRAEESSWAMVCGLADDKLIVIFRGDGLRKNMGKFAIQLFGDVGSAGGHKTMARAEIPLEKLEGQRAQNFIWDKLNSHKKQNLKSKPSQPKDIEATDQNAAHSNTDTNPNSTN